MKTICSLFLFVFLSGCAFSHTEDPSTQKYQEVLNQWLGQDKKELLKVWGNPSYEYQKNKIDYVVYIKNKMKKVCDGNQIERMPRMAKEESFFSEKIASVSKGCTTLFLIEDGYIRQWRFEGAECQVY